MKIFYKVILADYHLPLLTYYSDESLDIGRVIQIPFRNKSLLGIVLEESEPDFEISKIKKIEYVSNYRLSGKHIDFIRKSADYYISAISNFLKMTLPIKNLPSEIIEDEKIDLNKIQLSNLSETQQNAYNEISSYVTQNSYNTILLLGVTGSGKTEVYFAQIADILMRESGQVLVLLPEILLTNQLIKNFTKKFGFEPIIWHSQISEKKKMQYWKKIATGEGRVIMGARSALYLPYLDLKLLIVEEEHDNSYKQEEKVIYNARDMAVMKGFIENIPVLLVSATPSVETYYNVMQDKFKIVRLNERFNDASLPEVEVTSLRNNLYKGCRWLSNNLVKAMNEVLSQKKQVILFINRKGYATLVMCKLCGYRASCKNCSSFMIEHRSQKKLICHHCGYQAALIKKCPDCSASDSMISCGAGVEKIAEEVKNIFQFSAIEIVTRDTVSSKKKSQEVIKKIHDKEVNIIIGTQIIAKGHHFPDVDLVGVIDADAGLNGGDLKASERTFHLIEQVSGRSGRESNQGKTVIQTYNISNSAFSAIAEHNIEKFYINELEIRRNAFMPPFSRLATVLLTSKNSTKLLDFAKIMARKLCHDKVKIYGPSEANPFRILNKFRYKILVQASKNFPLQSLLSSVLDSVNATSSTHIKIDIDPYNFD